MSIVPVGQQGATLDISPDRGPVPVVAGASTGEVVVVPDDGQPSIVPLGGGVSIVPAASTPTFDLDATGQPEGHVPTAQGDDTWAWAEQAGGGAETPDTGPVNARPWHAAIPSPGEFETSWATVRARRFGPIVYLSAEVYPTAGFSGNAAIIQLPNGWRSMDFFGYASVQTYNPGNVASVAIQGGEIWLTANPGNNGGGSMSFSATFMTANAWPA